MIEDDQKLDEEKDVDWERKAALLRILHQNYVAFNVELPEDVVVDYEMDVCDMLPIPTGRLLEIWKLALTRHTTRFRLTFGDVNKVWKEVQVAEAKKLGLTRDKVRRGLSAHINKDEPVETI